VLDADAAAGEPDLDGELAVDPGDWAWSRRLSVIPATGRPPWDHAADDAEACQCEAHNPPQRRAEAVSEW